ncbi:adenylate/guanylate cyclase domain-containing protein [Nocardia mangyaensis]|uniref:Adenylate/guanylate cyclase domain-containing protein n=1 Tax=Nocardia mangyaensis TaxID=2213200 RepID=A0A1J0VMA5_9NOCA|nr:adenylate/guanylate cyclase domain-containing protein [Nocardia mangyaensis]APE33154.1 adenylate/guanylate cyclase domain-containing protein [Nocardia mangyaensis]
MSDAEMTELVQRSVEEALLGGPRRFTRTQVAEQSGVPEAESRRLWTALGFPANSDEEVDYTQLDITSVTNFRNMKVVAAADIRQQAAAARTIGQGMARLAEWQADLVLAEIKARAAAGDPAIPLDERVRVATESTMASIEQLQSYVWRRHLAAAAARSTDVPGDGSTRTLAVGFADMVGFTRLTRHLHPDELSTLLEAFESTTTSAITDNGGWVIKNVGDEVMFAAETAADAARISLSIQESTMLVGGTPELRVAFAYGEVLQRLGDLYGSVVNIAARLTGVARPGNVLIDDGAAEALDEHPEFAIRHLRSVRVRGFNRLRPHRLRRA